MDKLEVKIEQHLKDGWRLRGDILGSDVGTLGLIQVMVKWFLLIFIVILLRKFDSAWSLKINFNYAKKYYTFWNLFNYMQINFLIFF